MDPVRTKTSWSATENRWWPAWVLLSLVVAGVPLVLEVTLEHQPFWTLLAFPVAAVLQIAGAARSRVRLTEAGVEVRRLRTRLYRWSDIASVERAPEWESRTTVWLRLHGSVPTAAPEELVLPGVRARRAEGPTLGAFVGSVRLRAGLGLESPAQPGTPPPVT